MPVELRPSSTSTPPPVAEGTVRKDDKPGKPDQDAKNTSGDKDEKAGETSDEDSELRETQRLKPLSTKKRKRKKRTSKGDGDEDAAALEDTEEQPASEDSGPTAEDGADEASRD